MKSRFFTNTQGLDAAALPRDQVCVCLRMNRQVYEQAVRNAVSLHITSGAYIARLVMNDPLSVCGTTVPPQSENQRLCFPPAPPDH